MADAGYNILVGNPSAPSSITKSWSGLIPHYSVTVSLKLYKIDSWVNATIFFMVDGTTAQLYTFDSSNGGTSDFCGNPTPIPDSVNTNYNDLITQVTFTVPHTAPSLTLTIVSNLYSPSGSWGIRDFNLTMGACDESCKTCTNASNFGVRKRGARVATQHFPFLLWAHRAFAPQESARRRFPARHHLAQSASQVSAPWDSKAILTQLLLSGDNLLRALQRGLQRLHQSTQ